MRFTQFLFPHGHRQPNDIEVSEEVEQLASDLSHAGFSFEIEIFPDTQMVHADCCDEEGPLAVGLCKNGERVPGMIEKMVRRAHARWLGEGGKPTEFPRCPLPPGDSGLFNTDFY